MHDLPSDAQSLLYRVLESAFRFRRARIVGIVHSARQRSPSDVGHTTDSDRVAVMYGVERLQGVGLDGR